MTRAEGAVDPVDDLLMEQERNMGLVRGQWVMSLSVGYFTHYVTLYCGNDNSGWYNGLFGLTLFWEFMLAGQSIGLDFL